MILSWSIHGGSSFPLSGFTVHFGNEDMQLTVERASLDYCWRDTVLHEPVGPALEKALNEAVRENQFLSLLLPFMNGFD